MTKAEVKETVGHGIYRLFWKSGGFSLAAVGILHDGTRWFAPVNWTSKDKFTASTDWKQVRRAVYINLGTTNNPTDEEMEEAEIEAEIAEAERQLYNEDGSVRR